MFFIFLFFAGCDLHSVQGPEEDKLLVVAQQSATIT